MRRLLALTVVGFVLVLGGAAGAEGDGATVSISNEAYTPIISTIDAGGTVTWVNDDAEVHSVFIEAVGSDHLVLPGATYSYTFGDQGDFTYHCSLHNHAGKIVVAAAVASTLPPPPPPKPSTTTVATAVSTTPPATTVATTAATVAATIVTTAPPVTTAPSTTTTVSRPTTVVETTLASPVGVTVEDGGGGLPSAALIGGGGVGAVLGVGAGFLIQRRMGKRPADGA